MKLKYVEQIYKDFWMSIDSHVNELGFHNRVFTKTGYIMWENEIPVGILHYCVLWDNLPFLNFIFVKEDYRHKSFASQAMQQWEEDMKQQGYKMLLISTQVDETAQHFYRKTGYVDCGGLLLNNPPFEQSMEMFMQKVIQVSPLD